MRIHLSRHAKRRMKWREITEDEAVEAVLHPDSTEPSIGGRKNALKLINGKRLKVTYMEDGDIIVIISAVDRNR